MWAWGRARGSPPRLSALPCPVTLRPGPGTAGGVAESGKVWRGSHCGWALICLQEGRALTQPPATQSVTSVLPRGPMLPF